jgi:MIP family channel proteins
MTDRRTTTDDTPTTGQKFAAEVLGTFVLVFFGVGAALMSGGDYITTGLSFGLTVVVMAYAVGRISGGHFNPAVTLGAVLGGRLPWSSVPVYFGAQLVGGLVAGAALFGLMHGFDGYSAEGGIGANSFGAEGSGYAMWAAFALEALLTLVFLYVILAVTDERNEFQALMGPLTIGFALALIHFASMGATGTSVNPARSIGVGVFGGTEAIIQLWLFIVAPLVGAAIAGLTYPLVFGQGSEPVAGSGLSFGGGRHQQASYAPPANYEQQWNQGQPQQWQAPAAPPQQQWGQQPPTQPWGQPPTQPAPPAPQQPVQAPPQQWGQPAAAPYAPPAHQQPAQPPAQQWGRPIEDDGEDGRTQVRRPD